MSFPAFVKSAWKFTISFCYNTKRGQLVLSHTEIFTPYLSVHNTVEAATAANNKLQRFGKSFLNFRPQMRWVCAGISCITGYKCAGFQAPCDGLALIHFLIFFPKLCHLSLRGKNVNSFPDSSRLIWFSLRSNAAASPSAQWFLSEVQLFFGGFFKWVIWKFDRRFWRCQQHSEDLHHSSLNNTVHDSTHMLSCTLTTVYSTFLIGFQAELVQT